MGNQEGLLLESTAYEEVVDAIRKLKNRKEELSNDCRVIWQTRNRDFSSTTYTIDRFGSKLGEPTMHIIGGRGGEYEIVPKPPEDVWIRYKPPKPSQTGWGEELTRLAVLTPEFEYVQEKGWRAFFSDAFNILEEARNR